MRSVISFTREGLILSTAIVIQPMLGLGIPERSTAGLGLSERSALLSTDNVNRRESNANVYVRRDSRREGFRGYANLRM